MYPPVLLADQEEPREVLVVAILIRGQYMVASSFNPLPLTCISCLQAHTSLLIRIQSGFNPHPEVGYVIRFGMHVNAFTRMRVSLTRVPMRVKCSV